MATEVNETTLLQALADSTAIIVDRAATPEKVVGQGWLISKGRIVALASNVSHYSEAPYALLVRFPHPNINYSVRTIGLHPDFNKREARDYYLAQARGLLPPYTAENDIATLALDSDTSPPAAERIAEINRALSVPFEISPQDMSGATRSGDVPAILSSVLSTGRTGVLTFMDARNIPFARLAIKQTRIVRASFHTLFNEVAVCELLWRQPPGSFAFQPIDFRWPADVPEMTTPTEQLLAEAQRRFDELPGVIDALGGMESRFFKISPTADFSQIAPQDRWLVDRVWEALDGFMPLSKLPDRVGADSYSVTKTVYDLATMGLLNLDQKPPFHASGQIGPLILPANEFELNTWDSLTAFSLDPLTGAPVAYNGNFFGGAHAINSRMLLHTVPVPQHIGGAIVLKDGKFVGLHTGAYPLKGVVNPPPIALYRMVWVGSLNDLGTKRLRTAENVAAEAAEEVERQLKQEQTMMQRTSARMKALDTTIPEPAQVAQEAEKLAKNNLKILAGGGGMFLAGLVMMAVSFLTPHGQPGPAPQPVAHQQTTASTTSADTATNTGSAATTTTTSTGGEPVPGFKPEMGDANAAKIAYQLMGITAPPDTYVFQDSSKLTDPKRSFTIASDAKKVSIVFVEWPNQAPLSDQDLLVRRMPFFGYFRADSKNEITGQSPHCSWVGNHYVAPDDKHTTTGCEIGVFDLHNGKCMVYIAQPIGTDSIPDMEYPANLVESLIAVGEKTRMQTAANPAASLPNGAEATPQQLADYRDKLGKLIQSHYKPPHYDLDTNTKVALDITVDAKGNLTELSLKPNPNDDFNKALQRAVNETQPLPAPPHTKTGRYAITVRAHANDIVVEEQ